MLYLLPLLVPDSGFFCSYVVNSLKNPVSEWKTELAIACKSVRGVQCLLGTESFWRPGQMALSKGPQTLVHQQTLVLSSKLPCLYPEHWR